MLYIYRLEVDFELLVAGEAYPLVGLGCDLTKRILRARLGTPHFLFSIISNSN